MLIKIPWVTIIREKNKIPTIQNVLRNQNQQQDEILKEKEESKEEVMNKVKTAGTIPKAKDVKVRDNNKFYVILEQKKN